MPKNTVTDPITDQELTFAHLVLSGTMTDRCAAEAAGLNPETAAYTKAKPRVRDYMSGHRAAVNEKLVDQEVQGLRKLNIGRDQILTRLWELATLSVEATRGSMAGQIKALSMILAMEGLIPSRTTNDRSPYVEPQIAREVHDDQHEPLAEEPTDSKGATKTRPAAPHAPEPRPTPRPDPKLTRHASFPNLDPSQRTLNPFIKPANNNWVPDATAYVFDAVLDTPNSHKLTLSPDLRLSERRRASR